MRTKVTVFETAEERKIPENLFNALDYDVNEKYADFISSMDFTVVKVGNKFSLRDETNFGDIHSDVFDNAEDMTGRLDIYINDFYITDIAERLDGIVSGDLSTIDGIIEAINASADDEKVKAFFSENISDMQMLDLIANKTDKRFSIPSAAIFWQGTACSVRQTKN